MGSQNVFKHISKTKKAGTLFVKIKADPKEESVLIVSSKYFDQTMNDFIDLDPANMGIIEYQFLDFQKVSINFKGLECG